MDDGGRFPNHRPAVFFQLYNPPFSFFLSFKTKKKSRRKRKRKGGFLKTPLCVVVYPFLFGGNLCLNVLCMPPFHYPLKKHKRNHLFPPKLDTRETARSESSNIHKDRQTPTRLYLNSLILFFYLYLISYPCSLVGLAFLFYFLLSSTWTLPCTVSRE